MKIKTKDEGKVTGIFVSSLKDNSFSYNIETPRNFGQDVYVVKERDLTIDEGKVTGIFVGSLKDNSFSYNIETPRNWVNTSREDLVFATEEEALTEVEKLKAIERQKKRCKAVETIKLLLTTEREIGDRLSTPQGIDDTDEKFLTREFACVNRDIKDLVYDYYNVCGRVPDLQLYLAVEKKSGVTLHKSKAKLLFVIRELLQQKVLEICKEYELGNPYNTPDWEEQ